jgi:hypothetical protein
VCWRQGDDFASNTLQPMMWPLRIDVILMSGHISAGSLCMKFGSFSRLFWGYSCLRPFDLRPKENWQQKGPFSLETGPFLCA